jgi:hypothetical protein
MKSKAPKEEFLMKNMWLKLHNVDPRILYLLLALSALAAAAGAPDSGGFGIP